MTPKLEELAAESDLPSSEIDDDPIDTGEVPFSNKPIAVLHEMDLRAKEVVKRVKDDRREKKREERKVINEALPDAWLVPKLIQMCCNTLNTNWGAKGLCMHPKCTAEPEVTLNHMMFGECVKELTNTVSSELSIHESQLRDGVKLMGLARATKYINIATMSEENLAAIINTARVSRSTQLMMEDRETWVIQLQTKVSLKKTLDALNAEKTCLSKQVSLAERKKMYKKYNKLCNLEKGEKQKRAALIRKQPQYQ